MMGWQELANRIVEQAAEDYRKDRKLVYKGVDENTTKYQRYAYNAALRELEELEEFFLSEWAFDLTDSPDYIYRLLKEEADAAYGPMTVAVAG